MHKEDWKFSFKNLGALNSGEFEIKPLTFICGPNNVGKTWAMYAVYGFLNSGTYAISDSLFPSSLLDDVLSQTQKEGTYRWHYREWINENHVRIIKAVNGYVSSQLPNLFNVEKEILKESAIEWGINGQTLINKAVRKNLRYRFRFSDERSFELYKKANNEYVECTAIGNFKENEYLLRRSLSRRIAFSLIDCSRVFLMPAERNGLHLFYKELRTRRNALLHHASKKEVKLNELLRDVRQSPYARPIADYVDWLNRLPHDNERSQEDGAVFSGIAKDVLKNLSGGRYRVDKEGIILFKPKKHRGKDAPIMGLHTTSSTVKSMFGLWYYLEKQAQSGDIFMIDEPELNLHPKNQRYLARLFVRMVNAGLHVVISTHSDYIVREINMLLMLSQKHKQRDELMKKYGLCEQEIISQDRVGAYVAEKNKIVTMEMDEEGIVGKTFDDVINEQNEAGDDVYHAYKDD